MPRQAVLSLALFTACLMSAPSAHAGPFPATTGAALGAAHTSALLAARNKKKGKGNGAKQKAIERAKREARKRNANKRVPLATLKNTRTKESGGAPLPKDNPIEAARAQSILDHADDQPTDLERRVRAYRQLVGADPRTLPEAQTPLTLHEAALKGDLARVQAILDNAEKPKEVANSRDDAGRCPIHWAAAAGHTDVVKQLLDFGADPNAVDPIGKATALHYAAQFNHARTVQLLLDRKADASVQNARLRTPLDLAVRSKNDEIVAILRLHERHTTKATPAKPDN